MTLLILLNDDVGCHGLVLASAVTSQHHCSPHHLHVWSLYCVAMFVDFAVVALLSSYS